MFLANIPLNIDWQQILLHLLNFVILTGGLYLLLYKPVKNFMAKRKEHYEKIDAETNSLNEASKRKEEEINKRLLNLATEIKTEKANVNKELEEYKAKEMANIEAEADLLLKKAISDANQAKEKILSDSNKEIKNIVSEATEKLVLNSSTSDAYDEFLEKALEGSDKDE